MKKLITFFAAAIVLSADPESVPSTAVVVSTSAVTKTVAREPRMVVLQFAASTGELTAEVTYETVTRMDGEVVSQAPFKSVSLTWNQITNLVPALATSLVQFRAAAHASMTNTP